MGRIVALLGPQGGGKRRIAREILKRNQHAQMVMNATTSPGRSSDIKGEYISINPHEFQTLECQQALLSPGWHAANMLGTKKDSIIKILEARPTLGVTILEPSEARPNLLADLQNFILSLDRDLETHLVLVYVVPPGEEELAKRLEHRADPKTEVQRRLEDLHEVEAHIRGHAVPVRFLYNNGTIDYAFEQFKGFMH